jgi:hypothetical protein
VFLNDGIFPVHHLKIDTGGFDIHPKSEECFVFSKNFAAVMSAFDGMQPTFKQVPPTYPYQQ